MEITDIKMRKTFDTEPLKAIFSVTLDDCIAIHDIKLIFANSRYFLVMPGKKNADGTFKDVVHPINKPFRDLLEKSVIDEYKRQTETSAL